MYYAINNVVSTLNHILNFVYYSIYMFLFNIISSSHLLEISIDQKTVIIKIILASSSFWCNHFCPVAALYMSEKGTFHQEMHLCHCSDTFTIPNTGKCVFKENKTNQGDKCKTCSPLNYNIFKQLVGNINHLLEAIINCINLYIRKGSFYRHLHCWMHQYIRFNFFPIDEK